MKAQITTIAILLMMTIVSATYYSGETIEIPIDFEIVNCSVTNSTYDLEGLNLSWYDKNIIISTVPNYKSDNLTISCWVIKYGEVVEEHYDGSSGSSYRKKDKINKTDDIRDLRKEAFLKQLLEKQEEENQLVLELDVEEELIIEEPKEEIIKKSYIKRIIGVSVLIILLIGIIWYFVIKKNHSSV